MFRNMNVTNGQNVVESPRIYRRSYRKSEPMFMTYFIILWKQAEKIGVVDGVPVAFLKGAVAGNCFDRNTNVLRLALL